MGRRFSDQDVIARYIKKHGVTHCPTVALAPTQAIIPYDPSLRMYVLERESAYKEELMRHRNARQKLKARQSTSLRARCKKG